MNKKLAEFANPKILILLAVLLVGSFVLYQTKFSFLDVIADRVMERYDLRYSPYGPPKNRITSDQNANETNIHNDSPWSE